jgi:hypothetical protein
MPKDIADISRERDINKLADVLSVSRLNERRNEIFSCFLESNTNAK